MNGLLMLVPFLLVRFCLLSALGRGAVRRAAHFPPMEGRERAAYWIYQAANAAIVIALGFLTAEPDGSPLFWVGAALYAAGLMLCGLSEAAFSAPSGDGLCRRGLYRFSRNPMYLSYFLFFSGCALLTRSYVLGGIVAVFILSSHALILAEERWCAENFGDAYEQYRRAVRRYI